ncbi:MAG: hypothetical protein ACK2T2_09910 [Anaerolineales bacterium]
MFSIYRAVLYLHVFLGFTYMLAHGASFSVTYRLHHERELERVRALLELSRSSFGLMYASLALMLVGGVTLGFLGHWWSFGWIWASLGLLLAIVVFMALASSRHFHRIRKAAGLPYFDGSREQPAVAPAPLEELHSLLDSGKPHLYTLIGIGGWGLVLFFMVFKPF